MPARSKPITAVSARRPGTVNSVVLGSRGTPSEKMIAPGVCRRPRSSRFRRPSRRGASASSARHGRRHRRAEAGDSSDILGSGAMAPLLAAAAQQRLDALDALGGDQRANALGTADLVRRQRHKIGSQFLDIKWYFSKRLDRVDMQQAPGCMDDLSGFSDRLDRAGLVIGGHDRDQRRRAVRELRAQIVEIDSPSERHADPADHSGGNRPPASTEACSIAEISSRCTGAPPARRTPGPSASTLASVPPDVKTTLRGSAPTAAATAARASSTRRRAWRPSAWTDDGLPARSHAPPSPPWPRGAAAWSHSSRDRPGQPLSIIIP